MGAAVTEARTDGRKGMRPRSRALCCGCGELRTVAQAYRGRKPAGAADPDPALAPQCRWLACIACGTVTLHAVITDNTTDRSRRDGCSMERLNRLQDRSRRRIERRLKGFAAEGITVQRQIAPEDMQVHDSPLEILQHGGTGRLEIRICRAIPPLQLLQAIEKAEDIIDEPTRLGPWNNTPTSRWRGLSLRP